MAYGGARGRARRGSSTGGRASGYAMARGMRKRPRASSSSYRPRATSASASVVTRRVTVKAKRTYKRPKTASDITPQSAGRYWDARFHKGVPPALPGSLGKFHVLDTLTRKNFVQGTPNGVHGYERIDIYCLLQFSATDICAFYWGDTTQFKAEWDQALKDEVINQRSYTVRDSLDQVDSAQIQGIRPLRHTVVIRNITKADDVAGDIYVMPIENEFSWEFKDGQNMVPSTSFINNVKDTMNKSNDTRQLTAASLTREGKAYNLYPSTMDGFTKYFDFVPPEGDMGNVGSLQEAYINSGKTRAQGALLIKFPAQNTSNEYELTFHRQVGVRLDPSHAFYSSSQLGAQTSPDNFTRGANMGRKLH